MMNGSTIRPDNSATDSDVPMNTLRISTSSTKSSAHLSSTAGSYFISFPRKNSSFLNKLCPTLLQSVGSTCIYKNIGHGGKRFSHMSDGSDEFGYDTPDGKISIQVNLKFSKGNKMFNKNNASTRTKSCVNTYYSRMNWKIIQITASSTSNSTVESSFLPPL